MRPCLFGRTLVRMRKKSAGNVLFLILIAVALFAALSYAVSSSFRGGETTISQEQARVKAGELLRDMESIRNGYSFLWSQKGCSIDEISFIKNGKDIEAPVSSDFDAASPKSDESCDIFHPNGAGIAYPQNLDEFQNATAAGIYLGKLEFYFSGHEPAGAYGFENLGTASDDHMVILRGVLPEVCQNVNKLLRYDTPSADKVDTGDVIGDTLAEFEGQSAACRARSAGGPYDVFYVMQEF